MDLHKDVIAEMVVLVFSVALLTQIIVFTVGALIEVSNNRLLSTILTIKAFMSHRSIYILRLACFFEFEIRKNGSCEYVRCFHWSHLSSKSLFSVVRKRLLNY